MINIINLDDFTTIDNDEVNNHRKDINFYTTYCDLGTFQTLDGTRWSLYKYNGKKYKYQVNKC